MNKLTSSSLRSAAFMLAIAALLLYLAGQAYSRFTPVIYRCACRISLHRSSKFTKIVSEMESKLAASECRELNSNSNLEAIVRRLDLQKIWQARFHTPEPLSMDSAMATLRIQLSIKPAGRALLFTIACTDSDPKLAQKITYAIATDYTNRLAKQSAESIQSMVDSFRAGYHLLDSRILEAKARSEKLASILLEQSRYASNSTYDPDTYKMVTEKKAQMEADLGANQKIDEELDSKTSTELRDYFCKDASEPRIADLAQKISGARIALEKTRRESGPDSPEAKACANALTELNGRLDFEINILTSSRKAGLYGLRSALEMLNQKLSTMTTNKPSDTPEMQAYAAATAELNKLQSMKDDLALSIVDTNNTLLKTPLKDFRLNYTPTILDPIEIPTEPYSPDASLTKGSVAAAALLLFLAVLLLLCSFRVAKPGPKD